MILKYLIIIKILNQIFCFRQPSNYFHKISHYLKSNTLDASAWTDTLNLPRADCNFHNFTAVEDGAHGLWNNRASYLQSIAKNMAENGIENSSIKFLLDGPPYANGYFHMGHLLNRTIKDIIIRFWLSQGHIPIIIPGWDCHGLPIELKAKNLIGPESLTERCEALALSSIRQQALTISKLGCWAFWGLSYGTILPLYKNLSTSVFNHLVKEGRIDRGPIPVLYSPTAQSVLADSEINERRVLRTCSFVPFPLVDQVPSLEGISFKKAYLVAYTTEPWTLFANQGLAVSTSIVYSVYKKNDDLYISDGENPYTKGMKVADVQGQDLIGLSYSDPLSLNANKVINGETRVIPGIATGIIHLSGAHSATDFQLLVKNGVRAFRNVIDESGKMVEYPTIGVYSHEMDDLLRSKIDITHVQTIIKKLFCSRTGGNVFTRIIDQYWINLGNFKKEALNAVNDILIVPKQSKNFLYKALLQRPDLWCLSRQRPWGCPVPMKDNDNADGPEVMDVWFESGINWMYNQMVYDYLKSNLLPKLNNDGVKEYRALTSLPNEEFTIGDNKFYNNFNQYVKKIGMPYLNPPLSTPKFLMVEGIDQNRGWFQSSINMALALNAKVPIEKIIVHGFVIDENDKNKISKSRLDYPQADELLDSYGADTLRLFIASSDFHQKDVYLSKANIERAKDIRTKLCNTFRFILGLKEYREPSTDISFTASVEYPLDEDILRRLKKLQTSAREYYESTQFSKVVGELQFFLKYFSSEYLTIMKDVIYIDSVSSPRSKSAFNTVFLIGRILSQVVAPIAPHISQYFNDLFDSSLDIHSKWVEFSVQSRFQTELDLAVSLRRAIVPHLHNAVNEGVIKYFGQAKVTLSGNPAYKELIQKWDGINSDDIRLFLCVSHIYTAEGDVSEGLGVKVENCNWSKCDRCWLFRESVSDRDIKGKNHVLCSKCYDIVKDL